MLSSIFISYHFDDEAVELADMVKRLVQSHNIKALNGKRLGGQNLSIGVKANIELCQAIIIILTKREAGKTNDWVKEERAFADGKGLKIITLIEEGVDNGGMFKSNERLKLDKNNLHYNILDLSETINIWRSMLGQEKRLLLRPKEVSTTISNNIGQHQILYRIWKKQHYINNEIPNWKPIFPTPAEGGATLHINSIKENDLIEIEANINGEKWASPAANHNVIVELNKR